MKRKFQLSCESTIDLPYAYVDEREISVIFNQYTLNGETYYDNMGRDTEILPDFYKKLSRGEMPFTFPISDSRYEEYFERLAQKGDVLHIVFSSGLSDSADLAYRAARKVSKRHPDRKIMVVDSLCGSSGYGMLVDTVADIRDQDLEIEAAAAWILANRNRVHHQFFSTDLLPYKRNGQVLGPAAETDVLGSICSLMHLNREGRIIAYDKVKGFNKAISQLVQKVLAHIQGGTQYQDKLYIGHSNCPDLAGIMRDALIPYFHDLAAKAPIYEIGTAIASHCGPNTLAVFFYGDERE